jgi:hypothetical protein
MQTAEQILSQIVWREDKPQGTGLGTLKQVFSDAEILVVKKSKTGAKRATLMVRTAKGVTNVICSEPLTPLVRDGRVTEEHLAGFPLIWNDQQNSMYITFPSTGWVEVKKITPKEFKPEAVSHNDLID